MTEATVGELPGKAIERRLCRGGLRVYQGPFVVAIRSDVPELADQLRLVYRDYPLADHEPVCDLHARLELGSGLRRWIRAKVFFRFDDQVPFDPMPRALALPLLEWGINWAIAMRSHQYLMIHTAVVARDDLALVMPGEPGNGKTTLCAALVQRGWRLLSDEFGLYDPTRRELVPIPRLMPLKNRSIDVIEAFAPDVRMGPRFPETRKGTVAHVIPPAASLAARTRPAVPRWLMFPKWAPSGRAVLTPASKGITFLALASNAFNYEVMGGAGFDAVAHMVETCERHTLAYSDLEEAVQLIDRHTAHDRAA